MKLKLLLLSLLITTITISQEVFSDVFVGQLPASLLTIDGQLYIGASDGVDLPAGVYRINFNDPDSLELVSDLSDVNSGLPPFYMTYDPVSNAIFIPSTSSQIIRIDLNQSLPISFETVVDNSASDLNGGIIYDNGFVYYINMNLSSIQRIPASGGTPETVLTPADANSFVIAQIYENQLYYVKVNDNTGSDLFRIDLSNPVETLVSDLENLPNFLQSSYRNGSRLFLSFESSGDNFLVSLDLSQDLPLSTQSVVDDTEGAVLGITSYLDDVYFTTNFQRIFILEDELLNTPEFENINFTIFPNPSADRVFITAENQDSFQYEVFDILGKRVLNDFYTSEGIDFLQLQNGIYFVRITTQSGFSNAQRIIRQ